MCLHAQVQLSVDLHYKQHVESHFMENNLSTNIGTCTCTSIKGQNTIIRYMSVHQAGCTLYMLALPYLAYITVDLNPADWAASVAQLAEHWTSNPVVTGSNPIRGSSVFFPLSAFRLCLPCFPLF